MFAPNSFNGTTSFNVTLLYQEPLTEQIVPVQTNRLTGVSTVAHHHRRLLSRSHVNVCLTDSLASLVGTASTSFASFGWTLPPCSVYNSVALGTFGGRAL